VAPPRKPVVLHIASDYPGPYSPSHVTTAIRSLVENSRFGMESMVFVPRRSRMQLRASRQVVDDVLHLRVGSPMGSMLPMLRGRRDYYRSELLRWLGDRRPDVIHSHKLSYEATIGSDFAALLGIPHIVSVRGSSDTNFRNFRLAGGARFGRILSQSSANLWVSAWAKEPVRELTGYVAGEKDHLFPNAVDAAPPRESRADWRQNTLALVGRLDDFEQKGVVPLLRGLAAAHSSLSLDLIGPAGERATQLIRAEVDRLGLDGRVRMLGARPRGDVRSMLGDYAALVLLSEGETFGLVFIEALLAGTPIVYLAGSGVDGYPFVEGVGVRCASRRVDDVVKALVQLSATQARLRDTLHDRLQRGDFPAIDAREQAIMYSELVATVASAR